MDHGPPTQPLSPDRRPPLRTRSLSARLAPRLRSRAGDAPVLRDALSSAKAPEKGGLLESRWEASPQPSRPRRHVYRITGEGIALADELAQEVTAARDDGSCRSRHDRTAAPSAGALHVAEQLVPATDRLWVDAMRGDLDAAHAEWPRAIVGSRLLHRRGSLARAAAVRSHVAQAPSIATSAADAAWH